MRRLFLPLLIALLSLSIPMTAAQDGTPTPALPLTLVDSLPAGGAELSDAEPIVLYFSAPADCASAEAALVFEPALDGAITCDDAEASVTFTPSEAFMRGANYPLTIGADLRGQGGELLAEPVTIEWSTLGYLEVAEVLPAPDTGQVAADAVITVIFNRPVVPLVGLEDRDSLPDPLQFDPAAQGDGEWLNTSIYVFRPDPALAGGTEYTITVDADLTSADGATMAAPSDRAVPCVAPASARARRRSPRTRREHRVIRPFRGGEAIGRSWLSHQRSLASARGRSTRSYSRCTPPAASRLLSGLRRQQSRIGPTWLR